jgi:outer membrane lipoprotein
MVLKSAWMKLSGVIIALFAVSGCAHVISAQLREQVDPHLAFGTVLHNPEAALGRLVIWGGRIIETTNEGDGTTVIKVLQTPLDSSGFPQDEESSEGRFLVRVPRYLDPEVYQKSRKITVAGEISGKETRPLGEMEYTYPVISARELHLWKNPTQYPGPFVYDHWYWGPYPYPFYLPMFRY